MQMQDPNDLQPQGGQYIPPQPAHVSPDGKWFWDGTRWAPMYQSTADIPPQSPHHYSPAPSRRASGGIGAGLLAALAAAWAYGKYILLLAFKFPIVKTLITLAISLGLYAAFYGPWFAVALVVMILVHEMGHVVEIRRQGMQASAPLFIPFLGALVWAKSLGGNALAEARVGLAGPVLGTIGAAACLPIAAATGSDLWTALAFTGFFLNLFNLLPVTPLDGGRARFAFAQKLRAVAPGQAVVMYDGDVCLGGGWICGPVLHQSAPTGSSAPARSA